MKTFAVQPLVSVGPVRLGVSRAEVLAALGPCSARFRKLPTSLHPTDAWFGAGFQVFYTGADPAVEYIEVSANSGFVAVPFGHDCFSTPASLLVATIEKQAACDATDPEPGLSYIFPALELSLWRPTMEKPEGTYFATVGIGVRGYYSKNDA